MASRPPPVGTHAWVTAERAAVDAAADTEIEDFSYIVRNEWDWLNEHMGDLLDPEKLAALEDADSGRQNSGELLAATLKSPRKKKAAVEDREPLQSSNSGANLKVPEARILGPKQEGVEAVKQEISRSPAKTPRKQTSPKKAESSPPPQSTQKPEDRSPERDSGFFSQFQAPTTVPSIARREPVSENDEDPIEEGLEDGREGDSFLTANESTTEPAGLSSPAPEQALEPQSAKKSTPSKSPELPLQSPVNEEPEQRPSGRLASTTASPAVFTEAQPTKSPSKQLSPEKGSPEKVPDALYPQLPVFEANNEEPPSEIPAAISKTPKHPANDEEEEESSSSSQDTPILARKSSLNFAPIPNREPLTNKKSLGRQHARDSEHRAQGSSRGDWVKGKSFGSKSIGPVDTIPDEDETSDVKTGFKRKSKDLMQTPTKRQRNSSDNVEIAEIQQTVKIPLKGDDDENEPKRDSKTSTTQRLHDRIRQLSKSARSQRYTQPPEKTVVQPDVAQGSEKSSLPADSRDKEKPENKPKEEALERPTLARSHTEGASLAANESPRHQFPTHTSPFKLNTRSVLSPAKSPPVSPTRKDSRTSSKTIPSPTRKESKSPFKPVEQTVDRPRSPIKAPETPTKVKAQDGALSVAKIFTASTIKKAKDWMKSPTKTIHRPEILDLSAEKEGTLEPAAEHAENMEVEAPEIEEAADRAQREPEAVYPTLYPTLEAAADEPTADNFAKLGNDLEAETEQEVNSTGEGLSKISEPRTPAVEAVKASKPIIADAIEPPVVKSSARQTTDSRSREPGHEDTVPSRQRSPAKPDDSAKKAEEAKRRERAQQRKEHEEIIARQKAQLKQKEEELARVMEEEEKKRKEKERRRKEEEEERDNAEELDEGMETDIDAPKGYQTARSRPSSTEPRRPASRFQKGVTRLQQPSEPKRFNRAAPNQPKSKPAPVSIKMATASQREMQDQRKTNQPSGAALNAALKNSFDPRKSIQASTSQTSLAASSSSSSLRTTGGSMKPQGPLKSLAAASKAAKREQEEKERKAAQKQEIDRKRAELQAQRRQGELRKQQQQKRTTAGPAKTINRTTSVANPRATSQEPEQRVENKTFGKQLKRAAPADTEPSRQTHQAQRAGPPQFQQEGSKKRRTEEHEERDPLKSHPPIRSSVAKKDYNASKNLPHGYSAAAPKTGTYQPTKTVPLRQPQRPTQNPQVDAVKFSKEKISFATTTTTTTVPTEFKTPGAPASTFKTPGSKKQLPHKALYKTPSNPTAAAASAEPVVDSPIYKHPSSVYLPDIASDSEEEGPDPAFSVPGWAESPFLKQMLREQETVEPESVFGPVGDLDMDKIFKNQTERQKQRLGTRSSSANWAGQDRLTQAEIQRDLEKRKEWMEKGGWSFSPAPAQAKRAEK